MSFTSVYYYLLLVLLGILIAKTHFKKKYLIVLLFNYFFVLQFGIISLLFLFVITLYSYYAGKLIIKNNKVSIFIFLIPIILALVAFKLPMFNKSIIAPIGISFYSLQAISYLIEVYKDNKNYENNFLLFASTISLFSTIASGPIERLNILIPQIKNDLKYNSDKTKEGIQIICEGLFKKLVIANRIVDYVDKVYANPNLYNGLSIFIAIFLYSIQIYCDFSAYSDIALGSAKLIGLDLTRNFNSPYFSKSIKEFWRRWHITLSSWLRDYVYIPLGGNKVSKINKYLNILVTFLVSGLWHGLGLTYIIWGLIHGILNIIDIKFKNDFLSTLTTFTLVSFAWIFFRSNDISAVLGVFNGLFTRFSLSYSSIVNSIIIFKGDINSVPYALITFLMILVLIIKEYMYLYKPNLYKENIYLFIIVMFIVLFGTNGSGSFIYQGF